MERISKTTPGVNSAIRRARQTGLQTFFQGEGRQAIAFCYYLNKQYLDLRDDTALLFLHGGAKPLHRLTEHLSQPEKQNRIFGINLPGEVVRLQANQPKIVSELNTLKVLEWERIVLVDTGFKGSTAVKVVDMLDDKRLLDYSASLTHSSFPRQAWSTAVLLLCLRGKNRQAEEYNIEGFNYLCGQGEAQVFEDVAFLIEEGVMPRRETSKVIPYSRSEITQALIQAASAVPL